MWYIFVLELVVVINVLSSYQNPIGIWNRTDPGSCKRRLDVDGPRDKTTNETQGPVSQ